jgi:FKBP-type peptidyl-prolyl cis-trans isomerase FklB
MTRNGGKMNKFVLLIAGSVALTACGGPKLGEFSEEYICKAAIGSMFNKPVSSISSDDGASGVYYISYRQESDNKMWDYECKVKGKQVLWRAPEGRWRTDKTDSKLYWSVTGEGKKLVIREVFSDGSERVKEYTPSQVGVADVNASYALGYRTGEQMYGRLEGIDLDGFLSGMRDGAAGKRSSRMSSDEMDAAIMAFQQRKMEEQEAEMAREADDNLAAGAAYRATHAEKDGVTVTESGLQYEVLASGNGASPNGDDTVVAHYHGTLIDGTVFDSSVDRGEPATFPLNRVIEGWQEALPMMKVGDKWRIVLPPHLAYGEYGAGGVIGPNATLIFEVELLDIAK